MAPCNQKVSAVDDAGLDPPRYGSLASSWRVARCAARSIRRRTSIFNLLSLSINHPPAICHRPRPDSGAGRPCVLLNGRYQDLDLTKKIIAANPDITPGLPTTSKFGSTG
jgi:hypothetical protein